MDSDRGTRMPDLRGRRLLVTGASGFIGARLCRRALAEGAIVHGVSRWPRENTPDVQWEQADLRDTSATSEVIRRVRPDSVVHLASEVSGRRDIDLVLPMLHANLLAAVNVMLACASSGCDRVVLAGSMEEPRAGDEDDVAQSPYAVAKWSAHAYARHLFSLHDLPVVHLRVFMVYGPGQLDMRKLVPYATVSLLRGEEPRLSSGSRAVDWIYIDDVVEAFLRAAVTPGLDGRSLDIGSGHLVTIRDLVDGLSGLIGGPAQPAFGAVSDRPLERSPVADPLPAWENMRWRPVTNLELGLARAVEFYRARYQSLPTIHW